MESSEEHGHVNEEEFKEKHRLTQQTAEKVAMHIRHYRDTCRTRHALLSSRELLCSGSSSSPHRTEDLPNVSENRRRFRWQREQAQAVFLPAVEGVTPPRTATEDQVTLGRLRGGGTNGHGSLSQRLDPERSLRIFVTVTKSWLLSTFISTLLIPALRLHKKPTAEVA
jgi:hypothetical protein